MIYTDGKTTYNKNGIPLGTRIMPDGSLAPRIDGITKAHLIIGGLFAKYEFTKFDDKDPDNKKVAYIKKGYKFQWENLRENYIRWAKKLGISPEFAYQMGAIAVDTTSSAAASTTTTKTLSHTCTGDNLVLVGIGFDPRGDGPATNGFTYNSIVMSAGIATSDTQYQPVMYYLVAPDTGANTLSYTGNASDVKGLCAISFTGAKQSAQPDATIHYSATGASSPSNALTTVADNSFVMDAIGVGAAAPAVTGEHTEFYDVDNGSGTRFACQYVQKVTAGAQTMGWTWVSTKNYDQNIMSISPAAEAASVDNLLLLGVS